MSITFWAPDAPTVSVVPYEDEPDYVEERSVLPEINLSNTNAFAMMHALEVNPDYVGKWSAEELPALLKRAMKLANCEELRTPFLADTVTTGGELRQAETTGNVVNLVKGCQITSIGRNDEYLQGRALQFVDLFRQAIAQSFSVSWS